MKNLIQFGALLLLLFAAAQNSFAQPSVQKPKVQQTHQQNARPTWQSNPPSGTQKKQEQREQPPAKLPPGSKPVPRQRGNSSGSMTKTFPRDLEQTN